MTQNFLFSTQLELTATKAIVVVVRATLWRENYFLRIEYTSASSLIWLGSSKARRAEKQSASLAGSGRGKGRKLPSIIQGPKVVQSVAAASSTRPVLHSASSARSRPGAPDGFCQRSLD